MSVSALILADMILSACGGTVPSNEVNMPTLEIIPSATVSPAMTMTPEPTRVEEHELNPRYVMAIDREYKGVWIKADLITDDSVMSGVEVALAEYATRR